MNFDAHRLKVWVGRVLVNALVGGLWFAFIGAICGAIAGGLYGALLYDFKISTTLGSAVFGALVGILTGVVGIVIYAIAAAIAVPGKLLEPYCSLAKRVAWGQLAGTLSVCIAYVILWSVKVQFTGATFSDIFAAEDHLFVLSAPALMICGAIIKALFKRDTPKVATLEAE